MGDEQNKDWISSIAEIIGIITGIITILSYILPFFGVKNNAFIFIPFKIDSTYLIILLSIFVLIFLIIIIRKKMNYGKTDTIKHWHFTPHKKIYSFDCLGFKWDVTIPEEEYNLSLKKIRDNFDISSEPKCPNCDIRLDSPKDYIVYYKYDCFNCDFEKRTWDCLERITDHANELFKKELDKKINNK